MPFYEYECQACGSHHEAMQKMSDAPLTKCPECGKSKLVRLISAPLFRLKGSGWYETDFKSDKEKKRNLAGGDDAPATETSSTPTRRKAVKKVAKKAAKKVTKKAAKKVAAPKAAKVKAKARPAKKKATPAKRAAKKTAAKQSVAKGADAPTRAPARRKSPKKA